MTATCIFMFFFWGVGGRKGRGGVKKSYVVPTLYNICMFHASTNIIGQELQGESKGYGKFEMRPHNVCKIGFQKSTL